MENKEFSVLDLERHQTKDTTDSHINGELTVIWPSTKIAKVLVLADIAWKPNDNEMINVDFSAYSFKKWKNKS